MDRDLQLLDQMRAGIDYKIPIRIRKFSFMARPLTIIETNQVAVTVRDAMEKMNDAERNRLSEHTLVAKETLKLASKPDPDSKEIGLTDGLLDRMTNDEVHAMFKQYVAVCDKVNPSLELLSPAEVKQMVDELKKKDQADLVLALIDLSFSDLVSVCQSLIKGDLPTDK